MIFKEIKLLKKYLKNDGKKMKMWKMTNMKVEKTKMKIINIKIRQ